VATKIWTTKTDFDTGSLSDVVDHRNDDLQLVCAWSLGGDLNTARFWIAGCGTQVAGLCFTGTTGENVAYTEEYNGTSWSHGADCIVAGQGTQGFGTQLAAVKCGGLGGLKFTEEYDGTSWCSGNDLLENAYYGCCNSSTPVAGLCIGAGNGNVHAQEYNGTSWSVGGEKLVNNWYAGGGGTQTAAFSAGGGTSEVLTQEYDGTSFSSGGDLNVGRFRLAGAGTLTAGLCFGGYIAAHRAETEEYNGTSWISVDNLNTARSALGGCGAQTAGLSFGGFIGASTLSAVTEEYNPVSLGTWTVDFDSDDVITQWGSLGWSNVGGGSVKARVKSATSQGNLDGATWYPIGGGGFYITQPVDVECPDNRWYRLEVTLEEGSTPEVQQLGQDYGPPCPTITGNARIRPSISANGEICLNIPLYGVARIRPSIGGTARIRPSIGANGEICLNIPLYAVARVQPSIGAVARIRPSIGANGEICLNIPLYAVARIRPFIKASGQISKVPKIQYICCRTKITRLTDQMKSWENLVAEVTPPFRRIVDLAWSARIAPKIYEVTIDCSARIRLRPGHPAWVPGTGTISAVSKIRLSLARGKVYIVLKDQG
jgi:ubiquitin-protein ligase